MLKRILFISNLYPSALFPNMAAYNRQQIAALRENCEVEVISPIPWTALLRNKLENRIRNENSFDAHHPTYYYTPRVLRGLYGDYFYYSIKSVATRLLDEKSFKLIYSSWLYPDSFAAAKLAKHYNLPLFVKVHGTDVNRLEPGTVIACKSLEVANQAEKVLCVSRALKERLIALGVSEEKLEVLYNGVDQTIFFPMDKKYIRSQLNIDSDEYLILYVGNLKKEKGLDELINAFKTVTEKVRIKCRLVIIGSGAYRVPANEKVASLGISDNVSFLGSQPLETIALWMNAASLLCLPSYMEGVPNVVLEALSCGTRVVATRVGGIPELDRGDGMLTLIPARDSRQLAEALLSVSKNAFTEKRPVFITSWQENAQKLYSFFGAK